MKKLRSWALAVSSAVFTHAAVWADSIEPIAPSAVDFHRETGVTMYKFIVHFDAPTYLHITTAFGRKDTNHYGQLDQVSPEPSTRHEVIITLTNLQTLHQFINQTPTAGVEKGENWIFSSNVDGLVTTSPPLALNMLSQDDAGRRLYLAPVSRDPLALDQAHFLYLQTGPHTIAELDQQSDPRQDYVLAPEYLYVSIIGRRAQNLPPAPPTTEPTTNSPTNAAPATEKALEVNPRPRATFPLHVSLNQRALYGENGQPFFYLADHDLTLLWEKNREETLAYLDQCAACGFSAVQVRLFPDPGANLEARYRADQEPIWFEPNQPRNINPKYKKHWLWVAERAAERGLLLAICPLWLDPDNNQLYDFIANAPEYFFEQVGKTLSEDLRSLRNILWMHGGRRAPGGGKTNIGKLAKTIAQNNSQTLQTAYIDVADTVVDSYSPADWAHLHGLHTSVTPRHDWPFFIKQFQASYLLTPTKPILSHLTYDPKDDARRLTSFRHHLWASALSGVSGISIAPSLFSVKKESSLQSLKVFHQLWSRLPWAEMTPDWERQIVTAAKTEPATEPTFSTLSSEDQSVILVYQTTLQPLNYTSTKPAVWIDPCDGQEHSAGKGPLYTPPGKNAAGADDWLLLIRP